MDIKVTFLPSCQQRRQGVKRKIAFSKSRDAKNLPKLLPWETRYQHTMFDFLKKDQNNLVNQDKTDSVGLYKNVSFSKYTNNQVVENLDRKIESEVNNLEPLAKYGDKYATNLEDNESIESDVADLKGSEISSLKNRFKSDDFNGICDGFDTCSEFNNENYSDFRLNWSNNIHVVDNDDLYNIPLEFRVKTSPRSQMANSLRRRIPFEIGSLRYKVEDLDKLFSLPDISR